MASRKLHTFPRCPATCYGLTCDDWVETGEEYSCSLLESEHGCSCANCDCTDVTLSPTSTQAPTVSQVPTLLPSTTRRPTPAPSLCLNTNRGARDQRSFGCPAYLTNPGWCGNFDDEAFSSVDMCCGCGGGATTPFPTPVPTTASPTATRGPTLGPTEAVCAETCYGASCEYWHMHGYSCAENEDEYGCDCSGCECYEECAYTCLGAYTCDYHVFAVGFSRSCAVLAYDYNCDCSGCACPGETVERDGCYDDGTCCNTDNGATDEDGNGCVRYDAYPSDCGFYDDADFSSEQMCCLCGGGINKAPTGLPTFTVSPTTSFRPTPAPSSHGFCRPNYDGYNCDHWASLGYSWTCPYMENNYGYDCSFCECPNDPRRPSSAPTVSLRPTRSLPPTPAPTETCYDSDNNGETDTVGDACSEYTGIIFCGVRDDDDFTALAMCCVCGGGTILPPTPSPTWTQPPTVTLQPTSTASNFVQLQAAVIDGAKIYVSRDMTFESSIMIPASVTVEIVSAVNARLSGGGIRRLFRNFGSLTLCGLTLEDGAISTSTCTYPFVACAGGALHSSGYASVLILMACTLRKNKAYHGGAVVVVDGGISLVSDSAFLNNTATGWGGALFVYEKASLTMSGSTFLSNIASWDGGAMDLTESVSTITSTLFQHNSAAVNGGALSFYANSECVISDSTFRSTIAHFYGGAVYLTQDSVATVVDSTFERNTVLSGEGGALYADGSKYAIKNTLFELNSALVNGGALHFEYGSECTVASSTFRSNVARNYGGAISAYRSTLNMSSSSYVSNVAETGGAVRSYNSKIEVISSWFHSNSAEAGGALYIDDATELLLRESTFIANSALWAGGAVYSDQSSMAIHASHFQHNTAAEDGGACYLRLTDATISGSSVTQNSANVAGAIYSTSTTTLNASDSTFESNYARDEAGAILAKSDSTVFLMHVSLNSIVRALLVVRCMRATMIPPSTQRILHLRRTVRTTRVVRFTSTTGPVLLSHPHLSNLTPPPTAARSA